MIYSFPPLENGIFLEKKNRFGVWIKSGEKKYYLHLPNSGRLKELLIPGIPVRWEHKTGNPKTEGTLWAVEKNGIPVILVSTLVNGIFENCIRSGILEEFKEFNNFRREVPSAASRLDFLLYPENEKDKELWIEVKSVNLVEKDKGLFPDAPTSRGVKHLKELMALKQSGKRAAVIFMALREDAHCFSPHTKRDPEFSEALVKAHRIGVEVYAYRTIWNQSGCTGIKPIPVYFFATSG